ncbi:hypothetical protein VKT23_019629 [Stygiomarasmius scandens]|uniref:Uncharacterized protein n=1 Tax=Marasmiellus scandens TaxID=2682957 RepID=A0ABR1IQB0_9AGAR
MSSEESRKAEESEQQQKSNPGAQDEKSAAPQSGPTSGSQPESKDTIEAKAETVVETEQDDPDMPVPPGWIPRGRPNHPTSGPPPPKK